MASLLKTEADLRRAIDSSDSERALLRKGADKDKHELQQLREQVCVREGGGGRGVGGGRGRRGRD